MVKVKCIIGIEIKNQLQTKSHSIEMKMEAPFDSLKDLNNKF